MCARTHSHGLFLVAAWQVGETVPLDASQDDLTVSGREPETNGVRDVAETDVKMYVEHGRLGGQYSTHRSTERTHKPR